MNIVVTVETAGHPAAVARDARILGALSAQLLAEYPENAEAPIVATATPAAGVPEEPKKKRGRKTKAEKEAEAAAAAASNAATAEAPATPATPATTPATPATPATTPATPATPAAPPAPDSAAGGVTIEQIREAIIKVTTACSPKIAVGIVKETTGAAKASEVPVDKYPVLLQRLNEAAEVSA